MSITEAKYWMDYHHTELQGLSQKQILKIARSAKRKINCYFTGKYSRYELAACRKLLLPENLIKLDKEWWEFWIKVTKKI